MSRRKSNLLDEAFSAATAVPDNVSFFCDDVLEGVECCTVVVEKCTAVEKLGLHGKVLASVLVRGCERVWVVSVSDYIK